MPISFASSKVIAEGFLRRAGLDGKGHGAEVAAHLDIDKSTLFGKRDPRALNRGFTGDELAKLERLAQWREGCREFSRTG
jgi:hypothetical protein